MFGLGMGEIVLIAIVALLFLGPDKLPSAAKTIGKTIRGLRAQTRDLTDSLERDTELGDAVRELRSALHDDPRRTRPSYTPNDKEKAGDDPAGQVDHHGGDGGHLHDPHHVAIGHEHEHEHEHEHSADDGDSDRSIELAAPIVGEPDVPTVRPAAGSVARLYSDAEAAEPPPSGDASSSEPADEGKA